ncbi:MAG: M20/M25/M40 family metallo-hydrolase, partial [Gammaproteobacteria bacterium]
MIDLERFITGRWQDAIVPALCDYIRIPNKSPAFDADWAAHGHMSAAVQLLANWAQQTGVHGLSIETVTLPGRTPLLYLEVAPTCASTATVLLYGHYDKQPEFAGWREGLSPWTPALQDGRLYGRGGADDGYALFGSLTAIAALQAAGVPHARCVLLIEGCEESGSYDLPHYVDHLAPRIGQPDLVICLDAACGTYDHHAPLGPGARGLRVSLGCALVCSHLIGLRGHVHGLALLLWRGGGDLLLAGL